MNVAFQMRRDRDDEIYRIKNDFFQKFCYRNQRAAGNQLMRDIDGTKHNWYAIESGGEERLQTYGWQPVQQDNVGLFSPKYANDLAGCGDGSRHSRNQRNSNEPR